MNDKVQYDLFEFLPDGAALWRCSVNGRDRALAELKSLGQTSQNEFRVLHLPSQTVLASWPARSKPARSKAANTA